MTDLTAWFGSTFDSLTTDQLIPFASESQTPNRLAVIVGDAVLR